jgi:hypothetical protein
MKRTVIPDHRWTPVEWALSPLALRDDVTIHRVGQRSGPDLYAVRNRSLCLANNGEWEYEPMPSDRDTAFMKRCRFHSFPEALAAAEATDEVKRCPQ